MVYTLGLTRRGPNLTSPNKLDLIVWHTDWATFKALPYLFILKGNHESWPCLRDLLCYLGYLHRMSRTYIRPFLSLSTQLWESCRIKNKVIALVEWLSLLSWIGSVANFAIRDPSKPSHSSCTVPPTHKRLFSFFRRQLGFASSGQTDFTGAHDHFDPPLLKLFDEFRSDRSWEWCPSSHWALLIG